MERTPAKTRKNKRELDGTPDTPHTPYTPSSDSDIMSPPPVKRPKSRRGLGPLMEQQQNKPDNHQVPAHHYQHHHHITRRDENAPCLFPAGHGVDENKFSEVQRPQRPMPASPLLSRVLRNTENLQSPIKNPSYHGYDMDGIKPLLEVEDRVFMPGGVIETLSSNQNGPHLTVQDPEVTLDVPFPRHMTMNTTQPSASSDQVLEDNHVQDVPWQCPEFSIKVEEPSGEGSHAPVFINRIERIESYHFIESVVLSLPEQTHPPSSTEEDAQKQTPADDLSPHSDKSPQSEEWKMRQPKKRWLREARLEQGELSVPSTPLVEVESQSRPSVVVKTSSQSFSPIVSQPKAGETKEKLMGAMALIQLAEVPDEGSQPLNLSTARYTML